MRKRKFSLFVTPMLILGLLACNNDTNDAMDAQNDNRINTTNRTGTNVYQVNNRNNEVDDRTAYGFDHRGPLTEDYLDRDNDREANNKRPTYWTVRNNNDNIRNNGRNATRVNDNNNEHYNARNNVRVNNNNNNNINRKNVSLNQKNNNRKGSTVNWSRNNNANWGTGTTGRQNVNNQNNTNREGQNTKSNLNNATDNRTAQNYNDRNTNRNPNISNLKTSQSSNKYPHTKAVLIQEARYQFIPVNPNQDNRLQARLRQNKELAPAPEMQGQQQATPAPNQQAPAQQQTPAKQAPANVSQAVQQVIDLTNEQRRKNGLPALQADTQLNKVAQMKSVDMQQKGYFSHTSPTYGSPFDMMRDQGVSYKTAGENIAQGQRTPQEVVNSWMNSEGHRKNILSREFTHIGVGYEANSHHWTQMFIGK